MPAKCRELTRVEAHIRLASSMWYLSRMLGVITIICIILSLFYIHKEDSIFSKDSLQSQIEKIVKSKIYTLKPVLKEASNDPFLTIPSNQDSRGGENEKDGLDGNKKPGEDQQKEASVDDKKDATKERIEINEEKIKNAAGDILADPTKGKQADKKKDLKESLNKTVNDSVTSKLGNIYSGMSEIYTLREFYNFKYLTLYFNIIILLLCIFFNYSSALFLHYLRLKEVAYVLEFVRLLDLTFKDKASLKDFECYED